MSTTEKVTLSLPKELMDAVRAMAPPRGYSKLIAEAIEYFIESRRRLALRERLAFGYQADAAADRSLAANWEPVEVETWQTYVPASPVDEGPSDGA